MARTVKDREKERERHMNTKERHMNKKREGLGLDNKRRETHEETHESRYLFRERHMT